MPGRKFRIGQIKKLTNRIVFVVLVISVIYVSIRLIMAPEEAAQENVKVRSDYTLMLIQCLLGLVVMTLPAIVERKKAVDIPDLLEILYAIFLFCAVYLGEVRNFYYLIPCWDTILHAFSGAMLGLLGFSFVNLLNQMEKVKIQLSPFFVSLFAFCFALAAGGVWEIYEYLVDGLLSLNMQKTMLADGTFLAGRAALADTMEDLIVDGASALLAAFVGYLTIRRHGGAGILNWKKLGGGSQSDPSVLPK